MNARKMMKCLTVLLLLSVATPSMAGISRPDDHKNPLSKKTVREGSKDVQLKKNGLKTVKKEDTVNRFELDESRHTVDAAYEDADRSSLARSSNSSNNNRAETMTIVEKKTGGRFLAFLSLALSMYLLYLNKDKLPWGKKKSTKKSNQKETIKLEEALYDTKQRIKELNKKTDSLETRIIEHERFLSTIKPNKATATTQSNNFSTVQQQSDKVKTSQIITKYASSKKSDGFPVNYLVDSNDEFIIAKLELKGEKGSYRINDLPAAQKRLLQNFDFNVAPISEIIQKNNSPHSIVTIQPGVIHLENGIWKIVKKTVINLV